MKSRIFIFLIACIKISIGQNPCFFDSSDFYVRNKIEKIFVKEIRNDSTVLEGKIEFNKKEVSKTHCWKYNKKEGLYGKRVGKWDCVPHLFLLRHVKDTLIRSDWPPTKLTFDSNQRLLAEVEDLSGPDQGSTLRIKKYFYQDTLTKRLRLVTLKHPYDKYVDSTIFIYQQNRLEKTIEYEYVNKVRNATVYLYQYYYDGKLKSVCYQNLNCTHRVEYIYKLAK